jgi:hypothetical protein
MSTSQPTSRQLASTEPRPGLPRQARARRQVGAALAAILISTGAGWAAVSNPAAAASSLVAVAANTSVRFHTCLMDTDSTWAEAAQDIAKVAIYTDSHLLRNATTVIAACQVATAANAQLMSTLKTVPSSQNATMAHLTSVATNASAKFQVCLGNANGTWAEAARDIAKKTIYSDPQLSHSANTVIATCQVATGANALLEAALQPAGS